MLSDVAASICGTVPHHLLNQTLLLAQTTSFDDITTSVRKGFNYVQAKKHRGHTKKWKSPCIEASFHAARLGRTPDVVPILLQHQRPVVLKVDATHLAAGLGGIGVPHGRVLQRVHHQVTVVLHAQAVGVRASSVGRPHGLPAVDDKVAILLEDSLPLMVVGDEKVSFAELIIHGQVVSAHD